MVAPGNVAVGRSGGVILADATGFLATSSEGARVSQQDHINQMGSRTDFTQSDRDLE